MDATIALRDATDDDRAFLYLVYASTREEELAAVGWTDEQKAAFLTMQFAAQDQHYRQNYTNATFQIILREAEPIGRLYVNRGPEEIRIMDIALLPEHRGSGAGTALLRELLAEAAATNKPATIHVERFNPALRLYQRLGFRQLEERGVYLFLEWRDGQVHLS